jgi:hypothetical protein
MKSWQMISIIAGVCFLILFVGGQKQITDHFVPWEQPPLKFDRALVCVHSPYPDEIAQNSFVLRWDRVKAISPSATFFLFDPSYDSVFIKAVTVTLNGTNVIHLTPMEITDPEYGFSLKPKLYEDKEAFRGQFPNVDPRDAYFLAFPTNTALVSPPPIGTKVNFRIDFSIMAKGQAVCSTNVQSDFDYERQEKHMSWAAMLFIKLFMPRF